MAGDEKDGSYCSICGGIPPDRIKTKRVLIDGRETGIDHLDFIFENVKKLHPADDSNLASEILKRVREFNYVPTKKTDLYAEALLKEYRQWEKENS
jgi:hypothetical protein